MYSPLTRVRLRALRGPGEPASGASLSVPAAAVASATAAQQGRRPCWLSGDGVAAVAMGLDVGVGPGRRSPLADLGRRGSGEDARVAGHTGTSTGEKLCKGGKRDLRV